MTSPANWSASDLQKIASADDLHIAPRRTTGTTGTPTWIWSVAVYRALYVRPYRGHDSSWYRSALQTGSGVIQSGGNTYEVHFRLVDNETLIARVDEAYCRKYDGSAYLPAMVAPSPRSATVAVTPAA